MRLDGPEVSQGLVAQGQHPPLPRGVPQGHGLLPGSSKSIRRTDLSIHLSLSLSPTLPLPVLLLVPLLLLLLLPGGAGPRPGQRRRQGQPRARHDEDPGMRPYPCPYSYPCPCSYPCPYPYPYPCPYPYCWPYNRSITRLPHYHALWSCTLYALRRSTRVLCRWRRLRQPVSWPTSPSVPPRPAPRTLTSSFRITPRTTRTRYIPPTVHPVNKWHLVGTQLHVPAATSGPTQGLHGHRESPQDVSIGKSTE